MRPLIDKGCRENQAFPEQNHRNEVFLSSAATSQRGESMKDPVSVLGRWRGFHVWLDGSAQCDSTHQRLQRLFTFSRARAARSSCQAARPRHHSRVQTGERHPRPPRLFRPRWICTRLPDRLHQLSKPDTSAWCPSLPRDNAWGNGTEGRGPCRDRMEPARLRPETARKLLIGKAIVEV